MAVTEVTRENWISRIVSSIKGIVFGLLLFFIAFPVLFWNEGRAVKTARSLSEGAAAVVSVASDRVDGAFEGKLIHTSGQATTTETLSDPMFGVTLAAIKLQRDVEMFQWKENKKTETRKKVGGGEEKVTTYTYEKGWSGSAISSSGFKEAGHDNPGTMPFESLGQVASLVTVGSFKLSPGLIGKISKWEDLSVDGSNLELVAPELRGRLQVTDGGYYLGANPLEPTIGDVKVKFKVVHPTEVSIVGKQTGSLVGPYQTLQAGYDVELLELGRMSDKEMFAAAQSRNSTMTWVLRLIGFGMMFFGLFAIGRPFAVVADFIPFIGSFFRVGIGLFAGLLAFGLSFITIAIAWIFYRPLLGLLLLTLGVLALFGLIFLAITVGRKKNDPDAATA